MDILYIEPACIETLSATLEIKNPMLIAQPLIKLNFPGILFQVWGKH